MDITSEDLSSQAATGQFFRKQALRSLAQSLLRPREELSAFLLAHGGAAFFAGVTWGTEMQPNGYRVAYLTTVTGVAAIV